MALRRIVLEGDGLLRKRSREVAEVTGRIRALVEDMWETMYDAGGVGLAAVQVGVLRRVVVIDASERAEDGEIDNGELREENEGQGQGGGVEKKYVLINPEVVWVSDEVVSAKEGCLSVPGLNGVVERRARVRVRAMGLNGEVFEVEGEGLLGKAIQHELDHLEGILYTDVAESVEEIKAE